MKRITLAAVIAVFIAAPLGVSLWALRHRAPCAPQDGDLIKLNLSLAEPTAKAGKRYSLWAKVVLTNVSCHDLSVVDAEPFFSSKDRTRLSFVVRDAAGAEVPLAGAPGSSQTEYGRVIPYSDDMTTFNQMRADPDLRMDDYGFVTLKPGKSLATSASTLDPHEELGWGPAPGPPGFFSHGMQVRTASAIGIRPPPAGFRSLDRFVFTKPGRYTIRAVYDHPELIASPRYPYASRVPSPMIRLLNFLGLSRMGDSNRAYFDSVKRAVRAESEAVEFEVRP